MRKLFLFLTALCCTTALFAAKTLYLVPNGNWKSDNAKFAIYYFASDTDYGWSAIMSKEEDGTYKGEVPDAYSKVIFVRIKDTATEANWDNKWNQSKDLDIPTDGKDCYTVAEGAWDKGDGVWSKYIAPEKKDITYKVKAPEGTTECWIGGDWEKTGNWTFRQMGVVDAIDHKFELVVENQSTAFKYKYSASNDWDHKELKADGSEMEDRTFGDSIDVVAKFKVPAVTEWFIKGSFNGWADGYKLEGTDNTALSVKIALDANKKYEFKILRVNDKDSGWNPFVLI